MQVTLEVTTGSNAGKSIVVQSGQTLTVGRIERADLKVLDDPMMSNLHFAVSCEAEVCRLQDLGSRFGTKVNGSAVQETILAHGDTIVAGRSSFAVRTQGAAVKYASTPAVGAARPTPPLPTDPVQVAQPVEAVSASRDQNLLKVLNALSQPLYALLDAARDPLVLETLHGAGEEYQALDEENPASPGPFLVRLPAGSALLELLARAAWGHSWGLFLTSSHSFSDVCKHFRRFYRVKLEGGREVYFRFYDPRVLRGFLPTCTPPEATDFFGPVSLFLIESGNPEVLLRFANTARGAKSQAVYINQEAHEVAALDKPGPAM